jgi:hypothetical protein
VGFNKLSAHRSCYMCSPAAWITPYSCEVNGARQNGYPRGLSSTVYLPQMIAHWRASDHDIRSFSHDLLGCLNVEHYDEECESWVDKQKQVGDDWFKAMLIEPVLG